MLKKASGADEGGFFSRAWGQLSSRRMLKHVIVPVLVAVTAAVIALVVEYGFFNHGDGHHKAWSVPPTANMQRADANGVVWVAADGSVHVSGVLEDIKGDYASAQLLLVPSGPGTQVPVPTEVGDGAGKSSPIGSGQGAVFDSDTSSVEARVCTHDRSAGTPPQCGPPTNIYSADTYWDH